jgi:hypothetical protein
LDHPGDELSARLVIFRFVPQDVGILLFPCYLNDGSDDARLAIFKASFVCSAIRVVHPPRRVLSAIEEIEHIGQARNAIVFVGEGQPSSER